MSLINVLCQFALIKRLAFLYVFSSKCSVDPLGSSWTPVSGLVWTPLSCSGWALVFQVGLSIWRSVPVVVVGEESVLQVERVQAELVVPGEILRVVLVAILVVKVKWGAAFVDDAGSQWVVESVGTEIGVSPGVVVELWKVGGRLEEWVSVNLGESLGGAGSSQEIGWGIQKVALGLHSDWGSISGRGDSSWGVWASGEHSKEWLHELNELWVLNGAVTGRVHSSHDGSALAVSCVVTLTGEVLAKVLAVDLSGAGASLNRVEGSLDGVVWAISQIVFKHLELSLENDFLGDDLAHGRLNIFWEILVRETCHATSGEGCVSKDGIVAWQEHLGELLSAEGVVRVGIEVVNEVLSLSFGNIQNTVLGQEDANIVSGDQTVPVSVHSLEGALADEIWDVAKSLSGNFNFFFSAGNCEQEILESFLGFQTEHLVRVLLIIIN